ncbi:MAG: hypothetical protein K940chlam3_00844 [Chlamydiae bacterium]|nr:hypothetical protein [Chlamydiota bacterium]
MLQDHLRQLEEKLEIKAVSPPADPNTFTITIDPELDVTFHNLEDGIFFESQLCEVPERNREDIFIMLSEANLMGQGSLNSIFGMTKDKKHLIMTHFIDYDVSFQQFYDILEDYVNLAKITQEEIKSKV